MPAWYRQGKSGVRCPTCQSGISNIVDIKHSQEPLTVDVNWRMLNATLRRRKCTACKKTFVTVEALREELLALLKSRPKPEPLIHPIKQ